MIPSTYHEDKNALLAPIPNELIKISAATGPYNFSPLVGILYYIAKLEEAKNILEIGTGWCVSTIALACAARDNGGKVLSFDTHDRIGTLQQYPDLQPYIIQLVVNSHDFQRTTEILDNAFGCSIDLLFIDGDHTYNGVKADFEYYSQFLSDDGIIVLHDISIMDVRTDLPEHSIEVFRFWNDIDETKFQKFGLYASNGLGLIRKRPK